MKRTTIYCLIAAALLGLSGCVDNDYDLDDLDLTVGLGKDLALPMSSLGDLTLGNVLELTNDVIVTKEGGYYLSKEETADIAPVTFDRVTIDAPSLDVTVDFGQDNGTRMGFNTGSGTATRAANPGMSAVGEALLASFAGYTYTYADDENEFGFTGKNMDDISTDVVSVTHFDLVENTIRATFAFKAPKVLKTMTMKNFVMTLPKGLSVKVIGFTRNDDGSKVDYAYDPQKRTLTVASCLVPSAGITATFAVAGVDVGEGNCVSFDVKEHKVHFNAAVTLSRDMTLSVKRDNLDDALLATMSDQQVADALQELAAADAVKLNAAVRFLHDICPSRFYGVLKHPFDENNELDLGNLPDFLTDEDVVLDLANPAFYLRASYGMDNSTVTLSNVTLNSIYENPDKANGQLRIPSLTFTGAANMANEKVYCLSNAATSYAAPEGYAAGNGVEGGTVTGLDIASLIRDIPDKVSYSLDTAMIVCNGTPIYDAAKKTMTYPVSLKYHIYSPLELGEDFMLVYRDTTADWHEDIMDNDVDKYKFQALKVTATVESELPLTTELEFFPIDTKGKKIDDALIKVYSAKKADGSTARTLTVPGKATTEVTYYIEPSQKDYKKAIEKLDGVIIQAKASHASPEPLTESQKIKVTNLRLSLVGTVVADLN